MRNLSPDVVQLATFLSTPVLLHVTRARLSTLQFGRARLTPAITLLWFWSPSWIRLIELVFCLRSASSLRLRCLLLFIPTSLSLLFLCITFTCLLMAEPPCPARARARRGGAQTSKRCKTIEPPSNMVRDGHHSWTPPSKIVHMRDRTRMRNAPSQMDRAHANSHCGFADGSCACAFALRCRIWTVCTRIRIASLANKKMCLYICVAVSQMLRVECEFA